MKILLVVPSYSHGKNAFFFPLGMASISACLKEHGHQVAGLNFNNYDFAERLTVLQKTLAEQHFDLVATGGLSVTMDSLQTILQAVKRHSPATLTVAGGGVITADPDLQFAHLRPDFAVRGEGEETMVALAAALESGQTDFSHIRGLLFWRQGQPVSTPDRPAIADLDKLPLPDLEGLGMRDYVAMQKNHRSYHLIEASSDPAAIIAASRSCPYKCTFCFHPTSQVYRRVPTQRVITEIKKIQQDYQVNTFGVIDELFDYDMNRIHDFCRALQDNDIKIRWMCQLRVNKVNLDMLREMKKAGCYLISYGFESGSDTILKSMKKRIKAADIARAFHLTREAGIAMQANFLYGDPAETRQTVQETQAFKQQNKMFFMDWSAVIPFPGSPLYHQCVARGLITDRIAFTRQISDSNTFYWDYAQPRLNMTGMADDEAQALYLALRESCEQSHRQLCAIIRQRRALSATLCELHLTCPTCATPLVQPVAYPPDIAAGARPDPTTPFFGLRGINLLCHHCHNKMHLPSWEFPAIGAMFQRFRQWVASWVQTQTPVVVLPAMDRFLATFAEQIDLSGLVVAATLDTRPHRFGQNFLGATVQPATVENLALLAHLPFLILPAYNHPTLQALLDQAGIPLAQRHGWPDCYPAAFLPS